MPPNYPRKKILGVERVRPAMASWAPQSDLSVLLWRSPSCVPVRVCPEEPPECPPPPLPGGTVTARVAPSGRGELCQSSVVCVLCSRLMFPYRVIFLSLFNVFISWLLSSCVCLVIYDYPCVFIVLSVQFDFVWSTRYSPVFLCVCLALSCPALSSLKTIILSLLLVCMFLYPPRVCTVTLTGQEI